MAIKRPFKRKEPEPGLTFKKSLGISTFIHILPLLFMLTIPSCIPGCGGVGGGNADKETEEKNKQAAEPTEQREIKEKNQEVEVEIINRPIPKSEEQIAYEAAQKKQEECKPFFGGVGIQIDPRTNAIMKVYKYYPAWSIGLKEGDIILNFSEIMGEPGTEVTIRYIRNGEHLEVKVKRGRICLEDAVKEMKPKSREPNAC